MTTHEILVYSAFVSLITVLAILIRMFNIKWIIHEIEFNIWDNFEANGRELYKRIPPADQMIFSRKHLHLWTTKQWINYLSK